MEESPGTTGGIGNIDAVAALRDLLVYTADQCQTEVPGTSECRHPPCRIGQYTTSNVHIRGPRRSTTIREQFSDGFTLKKCYF